MPPGSGVRPSFRRSEGERRPLVGAPPRRAAPGPQRGLARRPPVLDAGC